MKNAITAIVVILLLAVGVQKYTDFEAFDLAKDYGAKAYNKFRQVLPSSLQAKIKRYVPPADKQLNIFVRDGGFFPNSNAILKNTNVTWHNEDIKPHAITGDGWGSAEIQPGGMFSKKFIAPGSYSYFDSQYPEAKGEILVQ
jgi:plastocyanin